MPTREQDIHIVSGRSICQSLVTVLKERLRCLTIILLVVFSIEAAEADVYCPWNREEVIDDRCGLQLSEKTRRLKSRYRETQALT